MYIIGKSISNKKITLEIFEKDKIPLHFHKTDKKHGVFAVYATKSYMNKYK